MKNIVLTKENLIGKFIVAEHTQDGYFFDEIFSKKEDAEVKYSVIADAYGACEDSTCISGSVEIISLSEDFYLIPKKEAREKDMSYLYDDFDIIEIPKHFGYAEDYLLFFAMNKCIVSYRELEGEFLDNL